MRDRLKVLFLAADPFTDGARLELGEEVRAIDEAIQRGSGRDGVELVSHFATRTRDLQYALLRHEPHIVHFAGHGGRAGVICLGDEDGKPRAVAAAALGNLFGILDGEVRAVVLNACHTLPVVEALADVVDYAIGTNRPITDETAIEFSAAFYTALTFGRGVPQSFALAVNQLRLDGSHEADVPVLRVRAGVPGGPLLPARDAEGPASPPGLRQAIHAGDIRSGRMNVVGQAGAGGPGGPVSQEIHARSIEAEEVSFTALDLRRPRRD